MKNSVQENLRLAVEQLFVRIHGDLIMEIRGGLNSTEIEYNDLIPEHQNLVTLGREKIGFKSRATNQEVFASILVTHAAWNERENAKTIRVA